ncbi:CBO0543 family protein [Bacillus sp. FJAT-27245]|uniref:CBO0543 family protein n=1 Tax=Bacillus sp. FJAT-27245 TaxID=1684144 RepID=UPI0006A7DF7D|nr:CBO0543 family protein [Bacillus sp. FJAT-27245]
MLILLIVSIISIVCVLVIPKRLSVLEMYTTSLFASLFGVVTDLYLGVKLNLYGFLDKRINWEYILILLFVYPAANILYLNFYPHSGGFFKKTFYIIFCTCLVGGAEYISIHTHTFYYRGWEIWYSLLAYPLIFSILALNLKLARKMSKRDASPIKAG